MAALRIAFGALAFLTLWRMLPYAEFYFSDSGWFPRFAPQPLPVQPIKWTAFFWDGSTRWSLVVLSVGVAASLLMTFGLLTPVAVPLVAFIVMSARQRNPTVFDGGDFLLQVTLLFLAFSRCHSSLSLDAKWRLDRRPSLRFLYSLTTRSHWPVLMIQLFVCAIYLLSGISKLQGAQWWEGTATTMVLSNPLYARWDLTTALKGPFAEWMWRLVTWSNPFWEITFPLAILFRRTRTLWFAYGIGFHAAIALFLKIGLFGPMMLASYLAFFRASRRTRLI